ncbi:MAG: Rieske 2Fe-2S domain-containing protein [Deltaproteobacteria bacterium]|nr:Rieske 2Fe-2S domain-containing protein [Deltaproteobacteria bacterium]
MNQTANSGQTEKLVYFPREDGSRIPYEVYSSPEVYQLEQERIFRGPIWSFVAMEAEIPLPNDFKGTFVGDAPVVVTRDADGILSAWVNRCAHRGAIVCRAARGNARSFACAYHQWSYDCHGNLRGVPFRNGVNGKAGMPADFDPKEHGLEQLRVESYRGLIFATFSDRSPSLAEYLGPQMCERLDRIFHKPVTYLGCTRQYSKSNWKLYTENVRDPYHASLLHPFFSTFNLVRASTRVAHLFDQGGLHHCVMLYQTEDASSGAAYAESKIASFKEGLRLEDTSILANVREFQEEANFQIQSIFPQLIVQQVQNSLVVRQLLPKGPQSFELIFNFFGYSDDTPEMVMHRIKEANLVGPAGLISMEDTFATELVQFGTAGAGSAFSVADLGRDAADSENARSVISEKPVRRFWCAYREVMGL